MDLYATSIILSKILKILFDNFLIDKPIKCIWKDIFYALRRRNNRVILRSTSCRYIRKKYVLWLQDIYEHGNRSTNFSITIIDVSNQTIWKLWNHLKTYYKTDTHSTDTKWSTVQYQLFHRFLTRIDLLLDEIWVCHI